nr:ABC transporter substrate-binding protein [Pseudobdellovibrionaceae bacterium]
MKEQAICNFKPLQKWSWISSFPILAFSFYLVLNIFFFEQALWAQQTPPTIKNFRLSLFSEPKSVEPAKNGSMTHFLFTNLYRNLMHFDKDSLKPDLAEFCKFQNKNKQLHCRLKKNLKWSDGSELTAQDFLNHYKNLFEIQNQELMAPLLDLKNAKEVLTKTKQMSSLGVQVQGSREIFFEFAAINTEFLYFLASYGGSPSKKDVYSGPYLLKSWTQGQKMFLEKNPFYWKDTPRSFLIEVFFIPEDHMAFELYQKKGLDFLRRLPPHLIPKFEKNPEYFWIPVYRFDYIGLRSELAKDLREALIKSLNYKDLQKIFNSRNIPGCFGI